MNQKFSISLFAAGLPAFLGIATEILAGHNNQWSYFYQTPLGFIHALSLGAAFVMLVVGALGIQLPRTEGTHGDRKSDQVLTADSPDGTVTTITTTKETAPLSAPKDTP